MLLKGVVKSSHGYFIDGVLAHYVCYIIMESRWLNPDGGE